MRLTPAAAAFVGVALAAGPACDCGGPVLPDPPRQCSVATGRGCLPDETCVDGECQPLGRCERDEDCPTAAFRCVFPAQFCELRAGFGEECSATAPCPAGEFCALGRCRAVEESRPCGTRLDCPPGFGCDKQSFFCIEEAPCTLADRGFPELACDPDETCSAVLGVCVSECVGQCTPETEAEDCGENARCNGACRCVQCLNDDDCGTGLVCNVRSGQCQSENLCFDDEDCAAPLICDPHTALCQVAPPPCEDDFDCAIAEICDVEKGRCELPGGACIDDRFEDADTPANAEDVPLLLDTPKLLDDLQLCPDDDDIYAFALTAGDTLQVAVTRALPEARATLWLLDSDAETSVAFSETPPRGDGTLEYTAQVDEVVFLRVNALLAPTPYDLGVSITRGGLCVADFFEGAAGGSDNDDILSATPPAFVPFGVELAAEICPVDVDTYAIDLQPGEGVKATLGFDGSRADLDVAFVDASGLVIASAAGTAAPEVLERRIVAGGRVFVRVRGFGNSRGPYTLLLERQPRFVCADALEPDDDTPRPVAPHNTTATGSAGVSETRALCSSSPLGDVDRWRVEVEDFERLVVSARPARADLRVLLSIEDESGAVLRRSPFSPAASSVSFDATATGPLFVRAAGAFGQVGDYAITIAKENQTSCAPDASEPNDTLETRAPLDAAGVVRSICESDEDWFVLAGTAGKIARIDLGFLHGDGDLDLQLYGLDGRQILATSDGQTDGEHIDALLPNDGLYSIRVFSLTSGAKSRYTLVATVESP